MRLMLVAYYYPPCGGAAVQRWLRLVPILIHYGWQVTVVTTKDGDYGVLDPSLEAAIPKEVKLIRTYTPVYGRLFKRLLGKQTSLPHARLETSKEDSFLKKVLFWIRLNLIIPDARVIWLRFARKAVIEELRKERYDVLITTGPPHSTHLLGLQMKEEHHIKWVADFRDPWTKILYLVTAKQNMIVRWITAWQERQVLAKADLNVIVSPSIAKSLPDGNKRVLLNGYKKSEFEGVVYQPNTKFRIKYIGHMIGWRDELQLLHAMGDWLRIHEDKVDMQFIGTFNEEEEVQIREILPFQNRGFIGHQDAIDEMVNAELLFMVVNRYTGNEGMLTTKMFEYIGSRTPLICVGPKNGDTAQVINEANAGVVIDYENWQDVSRVLEGYFQAWKNGCIVKNQTDIEKWSIERQGQLLHEWLVQLSKQEK